MTYILHYWLTQSSSNHHLISPSAFLHQLIIICNHCSVWLLQIASVSAGNQRDDACNCFLTAEVSSTDTPVSLMRWRAGKQWQKQSDKRLRYGSHSLQYFILLTTLKVIHRTPMRSKIKHVSGLLKIHYNTIHKASVISSCIYPFL